MSQQSPQNIDYSQAIQEKLMYIPEEYLEHLYQIVTLMAQSYIPVEKVNQSIIQSYVEEVRTGFSFYFKEFCQLNAGYRIDEEFCYVAFEVIKQEDFHSEISLQALTVLDLITQNQLDQARFSQQLAEKGKVKLYSQNNFFIIKNTQADQWGIKKAKEDAREEISTFLHKLPNYREDA